MKATLVVLAVLACAAVSYAAPASDAEEGAKVLTGLYDISEVLRSVTLEVRGQAVPE